MTLKKVSFHTLGCRLNISETGQIAEEFTNRGYRVVDFGEQADIVFLNTCTVTDKADSSCRNLIRKAKKSSPDGKVVVAGCYAQMSAKEIASMKGVDLILGTSEKYKVFDYIKDEEEQIIKVDKTNDFWGASTTPSDNHTRAFLKIQDGCNYVCSYCIIPYARGRSRAIAINEALEKAQKLVQENFKEIILTGVNIGEFENSNNEKFVDLVRGLGKIERLPRVRISSVEPNTLTDELIDLLKGNPKFLDHFHIPLQSGDDEILKSMRRKYTVSDYKNVINKVKKEFPLAGIGADVILGYPGETEEQFRKTYDFMNELPITHFHVFPYSKRKGTKAALMEDHIPYQVKKERVRILTDLGNKKLLSFMNSMLEKEFNVLFERKNKDGFYEGYTSNYIKVFCHSDTDLKNSIKSVKLKEIKGNQVYGELT